MFKYILVFFIPVILFVEPSCGQIRFSKLFGFQQPHADVASSPVIEVKGEGYIFPYVSWNYQFGEREIVVQKINYQGDTLWRKVYGKQGVQYEADYMIHSKDSNYVMSGFYYELNDTTMYFYLLKVKPNGDSLWSKKYPPITKARVVNSSMIKQTSDNGYILCGARQPFTSSGSPLAADIYIVKTDSMGNMQWNKQFGGSGHDVATSVIETGDKGFLVGGYTSTYGAGNLDIYLLKIDSTGAFEWDKTYGTGYAEASSGMIQLIDGNYLLASEVNYNFPGPNNGQAILLKVSPNGTLIWQKKYGGIEGTTFNKVIELSNGDIVATGGNNNTPYYNQAGWLMKANANGDSLWARMYDYIPGYPSLFYGIVATPDNGFILTGAAQDTLVSKSQQAWVLKVDSIGCDVSGCQFVGVKEHEVFTGGINVFPNPSNGNFTVKSGAVLKKCIVMDVLGNTVYSAENIQSTSFDISLSQLSNSIYFLKLIDVHDKEQVRKLIIEY